MHKKLFPGSRLKISYQTPPLVLLFSVLIVIPCVTHNSPVNLFCSSCEDMLLYNKNKIFCKYFLHTWATRKSCLKNVFYGQKAKNAGKTLQQNKTDLILLQCFCSICLPPKSNFQRCLMGGSRVASYIHAQRSTFLMRVDEKCCSWPVSFKNTSGWLFLNVTDLILANKQKSFQNTCITKTGLSDFHKLISTFFKLRLLV